jgi:predicted nucleic acid-binding protein
MMVTKSTSPAKKTASAVKKTTKRRVSAAASPSVDADTRRQLVAAEAYFRAERRGFAAGREFDDWIAAEAAVDSRLQEMQVA